MDDETILTLYKVARVALLVVVLYGVVWYAYFTERGRQLEKVAQRMMEEDDR